VGVSPAQGTSYSIKVKPNHKGLRANWRVQLKVLIVIPNGASLASASNQTSFLPLVDQRPEGHQQSAVSVNHKLLPSPQTALPLSEKFPARTNMHESLTGSFDPVPRVIQVPSVRPPPWLTDTASLLELQLHSLWTGIAACECAPLPCRSRDNGCKTDKADRSRSRFLVTHMNTTPAWVVPPTTPR